MHCIVIRAWTAICIAKFSLLLAFIVQAWFEMHWWSSAVVVLVSSVRAECDVICGVCYVSLVSV